MVRESTKRAKPNFKCLRQYRIKLLYYFCLVLFSFKFLVWHTFLRVKLWTWVCVWRNMFSFGRTRNGNLRFFFVVFLLQLDVLTLLWPNSVCDLCNSHKIVVFHFSVVLSNAPRALEWCRKFVGRPKLKNTTFGTWFVMCDIGRGSGAPNIDTRIKCYFYTRAAFTAESFEGTFNGQENQASLHVCLFTF